MKIGELRKKLEGVDDNKPIHLVDEDGNSSELSEISIEIDEVQFQYEFASSEDEDEDD